MQKTVKTGFRGERKRILNPSLSQGEGEIVTRIVTEKGKCGGRDYIGCGFTF